MGPSLTRVPARLALACAALVTLAGCTNSPKAPAGHSTHDDGPPAVLVAGLDDLSKKAGCRLQGKTNSEELRQGECKNAKARYTLLTFASDKDQQTWLKEAKIWGGSYLVGPRWIAVGEQPELEALRRNLGGDIEHGDTHGSGPHRN
jgi:hypothetical protein